MAYDPFATRKLIKTQQALVQTRTFLRDTFTRMGEAFETELIEIQTRKGRRVTAPYVNELLPGKVVRRLGHVSDLYKPALVKPLRPTTTIDIDKAGFGENVYGAISPAERAERILAQDQADLDDSVTRLEEKQVSQLMFTGKITQIGEGVKQELDFNFTNREVLAAADRWTAAGVNPFKQLAARKTIVQQKSGANVVRAVFASDAMDAFLSNPIVMEYLNKINLTVGTINPGDEVNGATYVGKLNYPGLNLDLWVYNEIYNEDWNEDGTEKLNPEPVSMVPAGTVALLPSGQPFSRHYGAVKILNPVTKKFEVYALPRVPRIFVKEEPDIRVLQLLSRPIVIPDDVDGWYVLKVL